jgi:hypothetical protein
MKAASLAIGFLFGTCLGGALLLIFAYRSDHHFIYAAFPLNHLPRLNEYRNIYAAATYLAICLLLLGCWYYALRNLRIGGTNVWTAAFGMSTLVGMVTTGALLFGYLSYFRIDQLVTKHLTWYVAPKVVWGILLITIASIVLSRLKVE